MRAHWVAVISAAALHIIQVPHARAETREVGSVSCGASNRGALAAARALPDRGEGFVAPEPWRSRGLRYGTDELVGLIQRAAATVARTTGGAPLAVADLSAERGGAVARHASHQSGRDVDLIYYSIDRAGDPFHPDSHMPYFGPDGRATRAEAPEPASRIEERFFDLPRNWALIVALVSDPEVRVYRIFVSDRVRDWLFAYARATAVSPEIFDRVRAVLSTARDTGTHQDHLHVRITCSPDDVAHGRCTDASAAPPRVKRGKRRRGRKRVKRPRKWYAHVRCVDPRAVAENDTPLTAPPVAGR